MFCLFMQKETKQNKTKQKQNKNSNKKTKQNTTPVNEGVFIPNFTPK